MRGNCYVTCEALYHLLGGKKAGWVPQRLRYMGDTHWFLLHEPTQIEIANIRLTYIKAGHVEFRLAPGVRQTLFNEGYSKEYGARNVKRVLEKRISIPLSRLISSDQVTAGDVVMISEVGAPEFEYSLEGQ